MSETNIDKFLSERAPKNTKLQAWESQIFELLAKNATYETIRDYLEQQGALTSRDAIFRFVKAQKRSMLYEKAMQQRGKPFQAQSPTKETQLKEPNPTELPNQTQGPTPNIPLSTDIPKFEWDVKNKPKSRW